MKKESCDGDVRKNGGVRKNGEVRQNGEVRKDGRVKNDGIDRGLGLIEAGWRAAAAEYFLEENEIAHIRFRVDQVEIVCVCV